MTMQSIGDLASLMVSRHRQNELQRATQASATEATTGIFQDKAAHLRGTTLSLALAERQTTLLEQHKRGISEAGILASATQSSLEHIRGMSEDLANSLSLVTQIDDPSELKLLAGRAESTFRDTVNSLNSKVAGKYLFAGSSTDTQPLMDGAAFVASIRTAMTGATSLPDVQTILSDWFSTPGGPFETLAYSGSTMGKIVVPIGPSSNVEMDLRADSNVMRATLEALALSFVATDDAVNLSPSDQQDLLTQSASDLRLSIEDLTVNQGQIGLLEQQIAEHSKLVEAKLDRAQSDLQTLIGVDQFQAVTEFEATNAQLEIFYQLTARASQTSLSSYLR